MIFFFFQVDRENRDRQFVPAVFLYTAALKAFCVGCYRKSAATRVQAFEARWAQ